MFFLQLVLSALATTSCVLAAPALDAITLAANGKHAQLQNLQFETLKASHSCTPGQKACIGVDIAKCGAEGTWSMIKCSGVNEQCYAIPSTRVAGADITCASDIYAQYKFAAVGLHHFKARGYDDSGTYDGDDSNEGSDNSESGDGDNSSDEPCDSSSVANDNTETITVTQTLSSGSTMTLEPTTRTLSPEQASSLLSKLTGKMHGTIISSGGSVSATNAVDNQAAAAAATPTTIMLTTSGQSTASSILAAQAASTTIAPSEAINAPCTSTGTAHSSHHTKFTATINNAEVPSSSVASPSIVVLEGSATEPCTTTGTASHRTGSSAKATDVDNAAEPSASKSNNASSTIILQESSAGIAEPSSTATTILLEGTASTPCTTTTHSSHHISSTVASNTFTLSVSASASSSFSASSSSSSAPATILLNQTAAPTSSAVAVAAGSGSYY